MVEHVGKNPIQIYGPKFHNSPPSEKMRVGKTMTINEVRFLGGYVSNFKWKKKQDSQQERWNSTEFCADCDTAIPIRSMGRKGLFTDPWMIDSNGLY